MSYTPTTDFLALLRSTGGGLRTERMPGLDYVLEALQRAGLIQLSVGQTAPVSNQASTVWLKPASPSWSAECTVYLWNPLTSAYQVATPALWSLLLSGAAPSNAVPLMDATPGLVGTSLAFARADHVHPTDTTRAPLNSPLFTGAPQAPTPTLGDNTTNIATTAFVTTAVGAQIPIGGIVAYTGSTPPNAAFQFANGQAISRTAFATLFGLIGILFGSGDGVNTYNIPDLRGRVIAGVDGGANRLTLATMSSQALAGIGGAELKALLTANLPPYTPAGGVTSTLVNGGSTFYGFVTPGTNVGFGGTATGGSQTAATTLLSVSSSFNGTAQGGTSTSFGLVQPTMELQYLIRVA